MHNTHTLPLMWLCTLSTIFLFLCSCSFALVLIIPAAMRPHEKTHALTSHLLSTAPHQVRPESPSEFMLFYSYLCPCIIHGPFKHPSLVFRGNSVHAECNLHLAEINSRLFRPAVHISLLHMIAQPSNKNKVCVCIY